MEKNLADLYWFIIDLLSDGYLGGDPGLSVETGVELSLSTKHGAKSRVWMKIWKRKIEYG